MRGEACAAVAAHDAGGFFLAGRNAGGSDAGRREGGGGGEGWEDKYFIRTAYFEIRADCEQIMAGIRVVGKAARGRDASPGETKTPRARVRV